MPFISEEIWQNLKELNSELEGDYITVAAFPQVDDSFLNDEIEAEFSFMQKMIGELRSVRKEMNIPPSKKAQLLVRATPEKVELIRRYAHLFLQLGGLAEVVASVDMEKPPASVSVVLEECELYIPLKGLLDLDKEKQRLEKEIANMDAEIGRVQKKLSNEKFVKKAPENVVQAERDKLTTYQEKKSKLEQSLKNLQI